MATITKINLPTNATENITGTYSLFQYVQEVSLGWFWVLVSYAIFVIIFISLKDYDTPKAFAFAAFFNMILSIILRAVGFMSNTFMYLSIILVAIAAVWLQLSNADRI